MVACWSTPPTFPAISRTWSTLWCLLKDPSLGIGESFSVCSVYYSESLIETPVFPCCNPYYSEMLSETCVNAPRFRSAPYKTTFTSQKLRVDYLPCYMRPAIDAYEQICPISHPEYKRDCRKTLCFWLYTVYKE